MERLECPFVVCDPNNNNDGDTSTAGLLCDSLNSLLCLLHVMLIRFGKQSVLAYEPSFLTFLQNLAAVFMNDRLGLHCKQATNGFMVAGIRRPAAITKRRHFLSVRSGVVRAIQNTITPCWYAFFG